MKEVHVVSFVCDAVGGFDWYWRAEDAEERWQELLSEPEEVRVSEVWLFKYATDSDDEDAITSAIDAELGNLEDKAERHRVLRERNA